MSTNEPKYNIICLSNQLWDFPFWTNKKHVMSRLAGLGHKVLFVDPPINIGFVFIRQLYRKYWNFWRILTQTKSEEFGALVYSPLNLVPFPKITTFLHVLRIKILYRVFFDSNCKTILWVYHVQIQNLESYIRNLKYDILVYDCVDNYSAFPKQGRVVSVYTDDVEGQEKFISESADIVFASAPGLVEKLRKYNQNVFFAPNVGDYEKFKNSKKNKFNLPSDLRDIPRPVVAFTGAHDEYKFDVELFNKLASDHPNYSFVLIGPMALRDKEGSIEKIGINNLKNVYFLGARPFSIIQDYFAGFDVYIIPYKLNDYTVGGCFPIKFHDALAAGLPTVVTDLPSYAPFESVCYISKSFDEFSDNVKIALEEDSPLKIKQRQDIAKVNSWDNKVVDMLKVLNNFMRVEKK